MYSHRAAQNKKITTVKAAYYDHFGTRAF